jgi:hypothetical protein
MEVLLNSISSILPDSEHSRVKGLEESFWFFLVVSQNRNDIIKNMNDISRLLSLRQIWIFSPLSQIAIMVLLYITNELYNFILPLHKI